LSNLSCWFPAEAKVVYDFNTHNSWGCLSFLPRDKAFSPAAGFIKNGTMLVGVNISLPDNKEQVLSLTPTQSMSFYLSLCSL